MKEIPLTCGMVTIIDDEDFERVSKHRWHVRNTCGPAFYASRSYRIKGKPIGVLLHRFLVKPNLGNEVTHIDGDGLNNRRSNLREVTRKRNRRNKTLRRVNKSGFRGVSLHKKTNKYLATIRIRGRSKYLGYFFTAKEASEAYEAAAKKHLGENYIGL